MKEWKRSRSQIALMCAFCFSMGLAFGPTPLRALDLGDLLKIGGIGLVVSHFGKDIDGFINKVLGQRGIQREGMTKVVPVLRVGSGTAVGAVQVVGPASQVKKVQAVAELEIKVGNRFRARALLPVTTKKVATSTIRGVGGVGVSANIKVPL
ncbi:MAG: hypothetical protein HY318_01690 [Armatimonadetes bacterium]|nr:hypothetical protein [Armatimonadota bacterium]